MAIPISYRDLGFESYYPQHSNNSYLGSPHWKKLRREVWEAHPHRCYLCHRPLEWSTFIPHHRHYETLGKENPKKDMLVLCEDCHAEVHFLDNGFKLQLTKEVLEARLKYLYRRNRGFKYRFLHTKPSDILNPLVYGTGKVLGFMVRHWW